MGYDVVIDKDYVPWIIEVNPKPGFGSIFQNATHPFDVETTRFLRGHFHTIRARWDSMEERIEAANQAVLSRVGSALKACSVDAELLRQIMDMDRERQTAVAQGFEDLAPMVYTSLRCLQEDWKACAKALPRSRECLLQEREQRNFCTSLEGCGDEGQEISLLQVEGSDDQTMSACSFSELTLSSSYGRDPGYYHPLWSDGVVWEWLQHPVSLKGAEATLQELCGIVSLET